ncbi:MAG: GH1 family beta-glucosidase [Syntrophales bacterium]|nr:GH1 family beta-glucosidase [Syntrophales bacterium]
MCLLNKTKFPADFLWGTATSAYQIEGGWNADGKGESNWDHWAHTGKIKNNHTGDTACNHYHLWEEDINLMKEMGIKAYRFSIAWSRVTPDGKGEINQKGLDFYKNLVDGLLAAGIQPFVTLHHYDMPLTLEQEGGWVSRDTVNRFAEYAGIMARHLGDKVKYWMTHNEPICIAGLGYSGTSEPPGLGDPKSGAQAIHNLLVSHGKAIRAIKTNSSEEAKVGIVLNLYPIQPYGGHTKEAHPDIPEDNLIAARLQDGIINRWFLDAIYYGKYPKDVWKYQKENNPDIEPGDMEIISIPQDFLGLNYYHRFVVKGERHNGELKIKTVPPQELGAPFSTMDWEIYPDGLGIVLRRIKKDYNNPIVFITENGVALADEIEPDGSINDITRINFLKAHVKEAEEAISDGIQLKGYFVWSLMDNLEWEIGFNHRFGLVYVDFKTLERTVKASGIWYKDWIRRLNI